MGRHRGGFGGRCGGLSGGAEKPNQGLFGLGFFKPKPLGGEFKTEQDINNWFLQRGVKKIGRVEINPEPEDYLDEYMCKRTLENYAERMRKCNPDGHDCKFWHDVYVSIIARDCGIIINPRSDED